MKKEITLFASEEFFFWGGGGKLASTYQFFSGLEFSCIIGLELGLIERNKNFIKVFLLTTSSCSPLIEDTIYK